MTRHTVFVVIAFFLGGCATCSITEQYGEGSRAVESARSEKSNCPVLGPNKGFCPKANVREPIRARADDIRACYEQELGVCPDLQGRVDVAWSLDKHGRVNRIETNGLKKVGACVAEVIKSIRFPPPLVGCEIVGCFPFVFNPK